MSELFDIFQKINQLIFDKMKEDFSRWNKKIPYSNWPTAWDINNGYCEDWALLAIEHVGDGHEIWVDDYEEFEDISHCVLCLNDRFYDSQNLKGVDNLRDLEVTNLIDRNTHIKNSLSNNH